MPIEVNFICDKCGDKRTRNFTHFQAVKNLFVNSGDDPLKIHRYLCLKCQFDYQNARSEAINAFNESYFGKEVK